VTAVRPRSHPTTMELWRASQQIWVRIGRCASLNETARAVERYAQNGGWG